MWLSVQVSVGADEKSDSVSSVVNPTNAWTRAKNLFERERYYRAQQLLKDISLNYSGSTFIDSVQFLLCRSTFELRDYLVAADEFRRLTTQYSFSKLVGDAAFWESRCYFELSPKSPLDQQYTTRALDGFQRFLEDFPGHVLRDSAYAYIGMCREKLAEKDYQAAVLYFRLQEYASAILYSEIVLSDYYDTSFAPRSKLLRGQSYAALKDWERAKTSLDQFLKDHPDHGDASRARRLLNAVERKLSASPSSTSHNP